MRAPVISRSLPEVRPLLANLRRSDIGRAAGLGAAVIAQNLLALVFTITFARMYAPPLTRAVSILSLPIS